MPIAYAIPIIMGANIGTTITNSLASLAFVTRKEDFRRAFAGATVHDFFNLLTVIVFLPLELIFHPIQKSAILLTKIFEGAGGVKFTSPLKLVISPAVHSIKNLLLRILSLPNVFAGIIMLVFSIALMIFSLVCLVKTMRSLVIAQAETFIDQYLFRNDFTAFILALCLTLIVQSSSITTSLIVPLAGAGIVSLRRCYPYTLGANVGTTFTAILASFATVSISNANAVNTAGVTAAFAHLMFNIFGISLFYPLRRIPISCASRLATFSAESKKWAFIFVLLTFFIIPLIIILFVR